MTSASRGRQDPLSKQVDHQVGGMNDVLAGYPHAGRPPKQSIRRARILQAARKVFAQRGYRHDSRVIWRRPR
jgi:hypothetical protein